MEKAKEDDKEEDEEEVEEMEEDEQTSKGEESRLTLIINPGNRVKDDGTRGLGRVGVN